MINKDARQQPATMVRKMKRRLAGEASDPRIKG
jgi:hypothetical protein